MSKVTTFWLILFSLTFLWGKTKSIVCPPNYCDTVRCINEESCPEGKSLSPTFCGCCNQCVQTIGEGGRCLSLLGSPPSQVCAEGLRCYNGKCSKPFLR